MTFGSRKGAEVAIYLQVQRLLTQWTDESWWETSQALHIDLWIKALSKGHNTVNTGTGYEVSIVVQSSNNTLFVAERPMYWNVMGSSFPTQGGTDIIGYTGL